MTFCNHENPTGINGFENKPNRCLASRQLSGLVGAEGVDSSKGSASQGDRLAYNSRNASELHELVTWKLVKKVPTMNGDEICFLNLCAELKLSL